MADKKNKKNAGVNITAGNKKEVGRIINYLAEGQGAEAKTPTGCIYNPDDYVTFALSEAKEIDAVVVISKDNHLMAESFPEGKPIYFITSKLNNAPFKEPQGLRGVMRVPTLRLDELLAAASEMLFELMPGRGKNIAVYCDAPRLASQLLQTKHRLFIAEHRMLLNKVSDYDYVVANFVASVKASRLQRGRSVGDALLKRPLLRDEPMLALIKKFYGLLDVRGLEVMGISLEFIAAVIEARKRTL